MQRVTIRCRDKRHLREFWRERFSGNTFFLPTGMPYPLHAEFPLLLRTTREECGILLRAKVTQVIDGPTPSARGMIGEILTPGDDRELLEQAITEACSEQASGILDFSHFQKRTTAPPPADELILQPLPKSVLPPRATDGAADLVKSKTLFEAAQVLLEAEEFASATTCIRLALQAEPANALYRSKEREIERRQHLSRLRQDTERRATMRGKDSDGWLG